MKLIKNDSLQSFTVYMLTENGVKEKWFKPGEFLVVPEAYISDQIKTLQRRRLFKILNA